MKTKFKFTQDAIYVNVEGLVDYETQAPFKENLDKILRKQKTDETPRKIIFDFENLEFVGSSGITSLVQTLRDFNTLCDEKPVYQNLKSEFQKIFKAFEGPQDFDFLENELFKKHKIPMDQ